MITSSLRVDAVLFDKDGTLFDFATTWEAWAKAFLIRLSSNPDHAADMGRAIGFDFDQCQFDKSSVVIAGRPDEVAADLLPHLKRHTLDSLVRVLNEEAAEAPQAEAVPLIPLLNTLRGLELKLGVATNDAEMPARVHLDKAGVLDHFDFVAGFDSGFGGKPQPGQLLGFAKAMGVDPKRIAMVGDSTHDLIAGRAAGMQTVAVLTGLADYGVLSPHADIVFPDIGSLPDWVQEIG